jgi:hypothetical protein
MSKYQNPINKPEMVTLPRWEYARLLEAKTILSVLRLQVENDKGYDATTLLKLIVENEKKLEV